MKKVIWLLCGLFMLLGITPAASSGASVNWWDKTVWYLLFVRSFYDSDGDGIGDIQGVIEKLDYLNDGDPTTTSDLGVGGIWLLPVMEAESYHGYDTINYRNVEPDYGTNEDFRRLMDEAHARGIKVIVDLVLNHTSDANPWFEASAAKDDDFADWYIWETQKPGYVGPWGQNVWYYNPQRGAYYYAVFWDRMPDLNHNNPAVTQAIDDIARFWLQEMDVDGFRLDAVRYLIEPVMNDRPVLADAPQNRAYLARFNEYVHAVNPDAYTVGEIFVNIPATIARYTNENAVDQAWDFALAEAIIATANSGNKRAIESGLRNALEAYQKGDLATLTTNHDMNRLLTQLRGDLDKNRVAANLLLTLPGTPYIYYGEEIGMMGRKPDELIRRPMQWDDTPETGGFTSGIPWHSLDTNFEAHTVAGQTDDPQSLLSHYRNLIHLRNAHPALQHGDTLLVESSHRAVWGLLRYTDDEALLVVLNVDSRQVEDYTLALEASQLSSVTGAELIFGSHPVRVNKPVLDENGGFTDYVPVDAPLPPASITVIRLH